MKKLAALSEVLKHIELFGGGRIGCIVFNKDVLRYTGEHTGGYIDYARSVKGVDVAFTVKYIDYSSSFFSSAARIGEKHPFRSIVQLSASTVIFRRAMTGSSFPVVAFFWVSPVSYTS